jgi:steroid delta-isomerase-like uncharacterized protein
MGVVTGEVTTGAPAGAAAAGRAAAPKARRAAETENTQLVRRYFAEVLSGGQFAVIGELFADDFVAHDPSLPPLPAGPEGVALHALASRTAFPDQRVTLDDVLADGDRVAVRFTLRGTHRGDLLDLAPTGRRVEVQSVAIYRIAGGKMAEAWVGFDLMGMLQQLGVLERLRDYHDAPHPSRVAGAAGGAQPGEA